MPNKEFLEKYNLYQKFHMEVPPDFTNFKKPSIHLFCESCGSEQTFNMINEYDFYRYPSDPRPSKGEISLLEYKCAGCNTFERKFLMKVSDTLDYLMKVGQYPAPDISPDKALSKVLGEHKELFKKGLICESQGYGIAAYAYYRRIVEIIIDELLDSIYDLVDEREKALYEVALKKTKETQIAKDKIELIKDLLPVSLKPSGMNPLGTLYGFLSEGIHEKSDDECIKIAGHTRTILIYLVKQVIQSKQESKEFTESMKKVLEKKSKKIIN